MWDQTGARTKTPIAERKRMKFILTGAGKTGALVAEIAATRGHTVEIIEISENRNGVALTPPRLAGVDAVIDFTAPDAVMANIDATIRAGVNLVVGTTGWYAEMPHVRNQVERANTGFIWASNFSIGSISFSPSCARAPRPSNTATKPKSSETHHIHKLDAPSGTAVSLAKTMETCGGKRPPIASVREGEVVGTHSIRVEVGGRYDYADSRSSKPTRLCRRRRACRRVDQG